MSGKATESDILAWIEGELPEDRLGAVEAAFEEDLTLRAWASSMRDDRVTMQAWAAKAVETAPRGMAESALERVEREALLGPSEAEALALTPERESPPVVFRIRRYATAAAVVLLVGVIGVTGVRLSSNQTWFGRAIVQDAPTDGGLAMTPGADPKARSSEPHEDLLDAVNKAEQTARRLNDEARAQADATVEETEELAESMGVIASAEPADADTMGAEAFLEDVASGRDAFGRGAAPIIRPLSADTAYATLIKQLIGEVAIAGGPATSISPERASRQDLRDRVVVRAWSDDPDAVVDSMRSLTRTIDSPAVGWHVVTGDPGDVSPVAGAVCTVSLPGETVGFRWIVNSLLESGATRVELTLRDGSAPGPAGSGIDDASGALWWGEPIREWAGWVRTPVLISPDATSGTND